MVLFQILLDGAEPRDPGMTWLHHPRDGVMQDEMNS